ncbi:endonuclease exonuclease phosphatase family protein : Metal-dependent hydrolase OS=Singulisphaera acidiphila (strain ATCC BAA-1392 / DSM 18658 / VKM B-2454 / MOB10) GN=Sinac_0257 PE=4 SV=1: Exo_endo_phos [Gemmata massiliana]|uniref:Endonuclease/exonuclease/phosphatase domain-containing protein n=2 Tax=Gemmata massiliana TaxID=1210884 RepID=A0A6P2D0U1_9BACT|nr:endonuclease exonuclease phosphatase family protein : Metal-dependent hydrolase OS=Singulisphaera acidiphila (strain ATCC BAA-1392 / DSM 18658 / VKM B-2454 / MOB10) GN=Sinac_0257 PE=4 SV=1: Exo_endo_phos [Gemmata massiliana]
MVARVICFAVIFGLSAPAFAGEGPTGSDVKIMSFNVRYGTAKDGENHWDKRKEFLAETVKAFGPDLLGTQETLGFQRDFLAEKLKGFGVIGVGRDDGKEKGEMMALYWREARFEKTDGGHFWLSESPKDAGSKSWDSSLPRMVTWVRLKDKLGGKPVLFVNTHFDHIGKEARLKSAKLIREQIAALGKDCSVVLTGDFNSGEDSDPYKALFHKSGNDESPVVDSFRVAHPKREEGEGTTTDFKAGVNKGSRIDWIGVSRDWKVVAGEIDRTEKNGRTPSDHFPVTAVIRR